MGSYARLNLLDGVGYVQIDSRGAELLFQIITARKERASIACNSNVPLQRMGRIYSDSRLAAAIVDRLIFRGQIISTGAMS